MNGLICARSVSRSLRAVSLSTRSARVRYFAAARVAASGSRRSSRVASNFNPSARAVFGMICQMPAAPAREYAAGL